jgi:hypothetical protein
VLFYWTFYGLGKWVSLPYFGAKSLEFLTVFLGNNWLTIKPKGAIIVV